LQAEINLAQSTSEDLEKQRIRYGKLTEHEKKV